MDFPPSRWSVPLRVLDGAVCVFDAVAGVGAPVGKQSGARPTPRYHVPRICFVNKMDRIGADFFRCVGMIHDRLGAKPPLPLQPPIGSKTSMKGVGWTWFAAGPSISTRPPRAPNSRKPKSRGHEAAFRGKAPRNAGSQWPKRTKPCWTSIFRVKNSRKTK